MRLVLPFLLLISAVGAFCQAQSETEKHGSHDPTRDTEHYKDGEHNADYDHEAILGSEDAVDEFAHLPPEEAKTKLGELVDKMDKDGNGAIDMDELVQWIKASFIKLNLEETEEKMEEDDRNRDGLISWEEYIQAIYKMSEEELEEYKTSDLDDPEARKTLVNSLKYDKEKFAAADKDGDGKLNQEEYSAFLHPYDYDRMSEVESTRVLHEYDTNEDGKVEWDEYSSNPAFSQRSEDDMEAEHENFRHNDADSDGSLSKEEILAWVSPNIQSIASNEATHLIEQTDADKDGSLTKEEILNEHELWVGSEATDYGEMLRDEL